MLFPFHLFAVDGINETREELQQRISVKGIVKDETDLPLAGVTVLVKGTTNATMTSANGEYTLKSVPVDAILVYSFIGMQTAEVEVNHQTSIDVVLKEDAIKMDDVVVVAFGTQKKESMISSISTVSPEELKVPSSNLTTALAGRLSGVIAYQRSGEPGMDNADFFIRGVTTFGYKKDPLILIDGIESTTTDLARLQPDDIQAFSILKDATATALYGARGANGVIQITTKEGKEGPIKVSVRFENSWSSNTKNIKLADPITFMKMANEATRTRAEGELNAALPYSYDKIERTRQGLNPYVYPANDWRKMLMKNTSYNPRLNVNLSGGGGIGRYYVAASYSKDNGNLKMDERNNFNSNIDLQTYQLRSNINLDLTKTTRAIVRLSGTFDDYTGPIDGGEVMYKKIMGTNPVLFPAYYPSSLEPKTNHILFGNAKRGYAGGGSSADYTNPYAEMVKGYTDYSRSQMEATMELKQDLRFITQGLNIRAMFNTSRYSFYRINRQYKPYFYAVGSYDKPTDSYTISQLNENDNPTEYLDYVEKDKDITSTVYIEAALSYNRKFDEKHDLGGLLVFQRREKLEANKGDLQKSLPYRNQGLSGRFTYAFDNRYMAEFNFGYNGSERFYKTNRYGFFPAVGGGWYVSNEKFWEPMSRVISKLKLKATYGLVGNDAIGNENDRFFYLSNVKMDDDQKSYSFGENFQYVKNGITVERYGNRDIGWEKSYKSNFGIELGLLNDFEFQVDYFTEKRTNILMKRHIAPSMGLAAEVRANVGEAKAKGVDLSLDYNKMLPKNYWIQGRANFTYAHSEFLKYEEPEYNEKYRSHIGQSLNQEYGLIAERLFIDEYDVANSPNQTWSKYGPGDIKYVDMNGDGQITNADMVPIGYPTVPEIVYGFGFSAGNDRVDFSMFFQGSARSSFWINAQDTSPFDHKSPDNDHPYHRDVPLIKAYADNHWSETNRDIYALWPRLSPNLVRNNTDPRSTWFMRNGAFLRLKSVELGYTFPEHYLRKLHVSSFRAYVSGTNLLTWSGFDLWDIEMGGNGLGYPIQRVINLGIQVNF
ncbi:TonB-dependent receptor [Prevotella sp. 10(H)]|uniref:SusC/RagA family TonB-linked outer membrane protein n=1 Tax=Prevotella sp. 10(H) TaxID=1158294 RepID=UPI0009E06036|nr:TonB-dependent receptor [Prevotella sp. 10(H)]